MSVARASLVLAQAFCAQIVTTPPKNNANSTAGKYHTQEWWIFRIAPFIFAVRFVSPYLILQSLTFTSTVFLAPATLYLDMRLPRSARPLPSLLILPPSPIPPTSTFPSSSKCQSPRNTALHSWHCRHPTRFLHP